MAPVSLHQSLPRLAFGILDQHPALRALHEADQQDEANRQRDDHHDQQAGNRPFAA